MWIRDKSRRIAGCALAAALAAIPVVVSTIELGSWSVGAPSRHLAFDEVPGVKVGSADWAFAPVCYGEFWAGRQTAANWLSHARYAALDPFMAMRDGVGIVLSIERSGTSSGDGAGIVGGSWGADATGSILGPVLASIVSGNAGGSGGAGGSAGGGANAPGSGGSPDDAGGPGGDLDPLFPPSVMRPPKGEPPLVGLTPDDKPVGGGNGGTTPPVSAVPVPAALPLLLTGLAALGFAGARRRLFTVTRPKAA